MDEPAPRGSIIQIMHAGGEFQGHVRYCQHRGTVHFLGVEFFAGCRGWPPSYLADQLVDLRTLVADSAKRAARRPSEVRPAETAPSPSR
jgi:hypothetical protein